MMRQVAASVFPLAPAASICGCRRSSRTMGCSLHQFASMSLMLFAPYGRPRSLR